MGFLDELFGTSPSPNNDDDDQQSSQSPYYQPEESGQPAENPDEEVAREDYNDERQQTGSDPIPDEPPDWAKNLPNPGDYK